MWDSVKEAIKDIAPVAAGLLAGPGAGYAVKKIADALGTDESPEEILKAVNADPAAALKLRQVEADLEKTLIKARSDVIVAEAQGESWLQRNWRPVTMLSFVVFIGCQWLGITGAEITENQTLALYQLVQYGLTGYVVGRSAEKITKNAVGTGLIESVLNKMRKN